MEWRKIQDDPEIYVLGEVIEGKLKNLVAHVYRETDGSYRWVRWSWDNDAVTKGTGTLEECQQAAQQNVAPRRLRRG